MLIGLIKLICIIVVIVVICYLNALATIQGYKKGYLDRASDIQHDLNKNNPNQDPYIKRSLLKYPLSAKYHGVHYVQAMRHNKYT